MKKIVETGRLYLAELTEDHFIDLFSLLSNEIVHRYFPKALNYEESKAFLKEVQSKYHKDGTCFWGVFLKGNNQFIGICGILKQMVDGNAEFEVGYRFLNSHWGNGYATEAAKGCIQYAKEALGKRSIIALIREVNKPSIRVAERCGLTYEKETIFHGLPHRVYRKALEKEAGNS